MKSIRFDAGFYSSKSILVALSLLAVAVVSSTLKADKRGEQLYRNCTICHGPDGQGIPLQLAPALTALSEKYIVEQLKKYKAGIRGAHAEDTAGLRMLPMAQTMITEDDMQAVASYIVSLGSSPVEPTLEGGDPVKGQATYATCLACHGPDGRGNDLLNAPSLVNQHDWYHLAQLKKFKSGVRGSNPQDITGAQMRPMSMLLADEQMMKDVVAYIKTLGN
ncbi:c-type cytochrome [Candidatus Pelagisphaera phototrophica]|uniref:c-type cytochrome n=1 Tax=Candidatus Pelagisphaera phototrophica TaxID=2684113 RepID=UPI0019DECCD6|nr:c-type cytochrome [Candidatus Pelagisphaera phototrophica]QXD33351.1 c-type cytochrome [Candidatus Pelagisphaera phototrophica]